MRTEYSRGAVYAARGKPRAPRASVSRDNSDGQKKVATCHLEESSRGDTSRLSFGRRVVRARVDAGEDSRNVGNERRLEASRDVSGEDGDRALKGAVRR